jgi:hypothetical protein
MAKFLDRDGMNTSIDQIIMSSDSEATIITPYLKLSNSVKSALLKRDQMYHTRWVYREDGLSENDKIFLFSLKNIKVFYCARLHAKCYFNESEMVLGSLNLHEFSQTHNWEMGILIKGESDCELRKDVINEVDRILRASLYQTNLREFESKSGQPWEAFASSIAIQDNSYSKLDSSFKINTYIEAISLSNNCIIDEFIPDIVSVYKQKDMNSDILRLSFQLKSSKGVVYLNELKEKNSLKNQLKNHYEAYHIGATKNLVISIRLNGNDWVKAVLIDSILKKVNWCMKELHTKGSMLPFDVT